MTAGLAQRSQLRAVNDGQHEHNQTEEGYYNDGHAKDFIVTRHKGSVSAYTVANHISGSSVGRRFPIPVYALECFYDRRSVGNLSRCGGLLVGKLWGCGVPWRLPFCLHLSPFLGPNHTRRRSDPGEQVTTALPMA